MKMTGNIPKEILDRCKGITAKRPRIVVDHIIKHGFVTTEELKNVYGYNHPPRAARDVRECGIPLKTFKVSDSTGRKIAAYKFGDPSKIRDKFFGRRMLDRKLKPALLKLHGPRCGIYQSIFPERELQVDHRVPYEVAGDSDSSDLDGYMLLSASANRAKSWSCEHCANWRELHLSEICKKCYWAFPDTYEHVAMRNVRRMDIIWAGVEVKDYEELRAQAQAEDFDPPDYVKEIIRRHLK